MEELMIDDFADIELPPVKFAAIYDPHTGRIIAVGPEIGFVHEEHKTDIDEYLAVSIIEGSMPLSRCFFNFETDSVEVAEIKTVVKIDLLLHRIPEKQFSDIKDPDLLITVGDTFKFELAERFGGNKEIPAGSRTIKKMMWRGDTDLCFYVTDYNDPNVLYQKINFSLEDLIDNSVEIQKSKDLPEDISIYTRRLFKNYMVEMK